MEIVFEYETINEKINKFHSSPSRRKLLVGGFGSGKTTAACAEGIMLGMEHKDGLIAVCRNTFGELDRSTRLVFQEICPQQIIKRGYSAADHSIHFVNGTSAVFFPLDEIGKLKSLNASVVILDEASEITEDIANMLWARRGRRKGIPAERQCFLIASNPSDTNHWLYRWFGPHQKNPDFFLEKLSTYDNASHLPKEYIEDLKNSLSPELFERYVNGEWGHVTIGERIYTEFGLSLHVGLPIFNPGLPVLRGWDFSYYHPACVYMQIDDRSRVRVLAELLGKSKVIESFGEDVLRLGTKLFPKATYEDFGDPVGKRRSAQGETAETAFKILKDKHGVHVKWKKEPVKNGLDLIRRKFGQNIDGQPAITIHKERCPILIEGFAGGYSCKKNKEGEVIKDDPREDGYYEHPQDCFRYIMINRFAIDAKKFDDKKRGLPSYAPTFPGSGW